MESVVRTQEAHALMGYFSRPATFFSEPSRRQSHWKRRLSIPQCTRAVLRRWGQRWSLQRLSGERHGNSACRGMPVRLPEHADAVTGQDLWRIARKPLNLGISTARVG